MRGPNSYDTSWLWKLAKCQWHDKTLDRANRNSWYLFHGLVLYAFRLYDVGTELPSQYVLSVLARRYWWSRGREEVVEMLMISASGDYFTKTAAMKWSSSSLCICSVLWLDKDLSKLFLHLLFFCYFCEIVLPVYSSSLSHILSRGLG